MNIWYQTLTKPPFTPPTSYFPIAWGILYTLMAISFVLIITKPKSLDKYFALSFFITQLVFNFLWSYIFFELKLINIALLDVILLCIFLILTLVYFFKISKPAFWLLIPYLLQVIFAIYLNFGILILNKNI